MAERTGRQRAEQEETTAPASGPRTGPVPGAIHPAQNLMALQRAAGNRAVTNLLGASGAGPAGSRIQRLAFIGRGDGPYKASESKDEESKDLRGDAETRRFKSERELKSFANDDVDKNMGLLPGAAGKQIWIRIDEGFVVLGEDHGYKVAPQIIAALRTKRYRYEGEQHRSGAREKADPGMAAFFGERSKKKQQEYEEEPEGKAESKDKGPGAAAKERTHAVEHALPYYARVLPEVIAHAAEEVRKQTAPATAAAPTPAEPASAQAMPGSELKNEPPVEPSDLKKEAPAEASEPPKEPPAETPELKKEPLAETPELKKEAAAEAPEVKAEALAETPELKKDASPRQIKRPVLRKGERPLKDPHSTYSMEGAALAGLLPALLYARSYRGKFFAHPLTNFDIGYANDLDAAIVALQAHGPDVAEVNKWAPWLNKLRQAYSEAALEKVGLGDSRFGRPGGKLSEWKASLRGVGVTTGKKDDKEAQVTLDPASQEADYLRDKSMFQTIKESKKSGDVLFVIGEAHRRKLSKKLSDAHIANYQQWEFIDKEVDLNDLTSDPLARDKNRLKDYEKEYFGTDSRWFGGTARTVTSEGIKAPNKFQCRLVQDGRETRFDLGDGGRIASGAKDVRLDVIVRGADEVVITRKFTVPEPERRDKPKGSGKAATPSSVDA